jgi:hypothetical protein
MIPVLAVLYTLAGPLFWRDAVVDCEAAVDQINADLALFDYDGPIVLVTWDCDEAKRQDGLSRPYFRLTTRSGAPPAMQISWPPLMPED